MRHINDNFQSKLANQKSGSIESSDKPSVHALQSAEINFLDIKSINDVAHEIRLEIKCLLSLYHTACRTNKDAGHLIRRVYANHRTVLLRRQILDLWKLYQMARCDSRELTKEYLSRLNPNIQTKKCLQSL